MVKRSWLGTLAGTLCAWLAASAPAPAAPIVGGKAAAPGAHPHQAFVLIDFGKTRGYCGGSLVAARFVLTAAHCLYGSDGTRPLGITAVLGHDAVPWNGRAVAPEDFPPETRFEAAAWQANEGFDAARRPDADVAVLTLSRPAPFDQVRLPRPQDGRAWAPGTAATTLGWGVTEAGAPSEVLREVALPVVSDADCSAAWSAQGAGFIVGARMLCAGGATAGDSCAGDSGGALLVSAGPHPVLAGLTSFGSEPCGSGQPGVYTELGDPDLNAWVRARIAQVEIDASTVAPAPGERVTFSATGTTPDGAYNRFAWDVDGDGFDDGTGPAFAHDAGDGPLTVAVRATHYLGFHSETRTITLGARAGEANRPASRPTVRQRFLRGTAAGYTVDGPAHVRVRVTARGSRTLLATGSRRTTRAGAHQLELRLTPAGRRALRAGGPHFRWRAMTIRWISFVPS